MDAELRARSQGRVTLDDYVRRFYSGASGAPQVKPYVEQDVYDTLATVAAGDWRALIHRHLDPTGTRRCLAHSSAAAGNLPILPKVTPGLKHGRSGKRALPGNGQSDSMLDKDAKIIDVIEDRAAAHAGASPGMTIIAVNGRKFTAKVLDAAIAEAHTTHKPMALLVENSDYYRTLWVEYYDGPRYPHLVRVEGRPDQLSAVFSPRVK